MADWIVKAGAIDVKTAAEYLKPGKFRMVSRETVIRKTTAYPIDPCPAPRARVTSRGTFNPKSYTRWKEDIQKLGLKDLPEQMEVVFNIPMPRSWSKKKKRELNGMPHKSRPDLDNYLKALMDAAMKEDSTVWNIVAIKQWAEEGSIVVVDLT